MKKSKGKNPNWGKVDLPPDWGKVNGVPFGDFNHFIGQPTTWEELKQKGSPHYKNEQSSVELIDLWRYMKPHPSLTVGQIKGLTDTMKYAYRMLKSGIDDKFLSDCNKVIHYNQLLLASVEDK